MRFTSDRLVEILFLSFRSKRIEVGIPSTCVPENMRPTPFLGLCHLPGTPSPNASSLQGMLTPNLNVTEGPDAQHQYS